MLAPETKIKLRRSLRVKIIILFFTIILIASMFPRGESLESEVTVGSVWIQDDLIASTTFEVLKSQDVYEREKIEAASKVQPIFLRDNSVPLITLDSIKKYSDILTKLKAPFNPDLIHEKYFPFLSDITVNTFIRLKKEPQSFSGLRKRSIPEILLLTRDLVERVYKRGLLNVTLNEISKDSISVRDGKFERVFPKSIYHDRKTVIQYIGEFFNSAIGGNKEVNEALQEFVNYFLRPNLIYSAELTTLAINNAKEKVTRNVGIVNENERIIAKHDRITPEAKLKIDSYRLAKGQETSFWGRFAQNFGKFIHIFIILLPIVIYIYLFRKRIYHDNLKILLIAIIILFVSFLTFIIYQLNVTAPIEFLVLVPVASMLLTIIFDSRIGFYGTVIISLIVGGLRGNDYVFAVTNIVAGGLSAYTVRDIKNRTQIFRSFFYILTGYLISILAFGLERFETFDQMLSGAAIAASNALISPVFTYGLIIFIERIFKITTDLTLLELTDFNHPLLKELARNAPGTFNHSMVMGSLAESAAEAIGANSILARVGAYYHDIGKALDPHSFVENQLKNENIHENLKPEESVKLILDHVERGVEMAVKNNLPQEIINFIPMHHGTMVISFFYEKAKKIYGEENVNITGYRYKGPKPDSKETAIVMLADACESAVRSLNDSDPKKIENIINNLINSRIEDGQLDNAPVTFRDIKKIKEAFLNILIGQHHKRIRYPKQEELETGRENEK